MGAPDEPESFQLKRYEERYDQARGEYAAENGRFDAAESKIVR